MGQLGLRPGGPPVPVERLLGAGFGAAGSASRPLRRRSRRRSAVRRGCDDVINGDDVIDAAGCWGDAVGATAERSDAPGDADGQLAHLQPGEG